MKLQEGSFYRTRNGLKAKITRIAPGVAWAEVHTTTGSRKFHYFADGRYHNSVETIWDLVEPWVPEVLPGKRKLVIEGKVQHGALFFLSEAVGGTLGDLEGKRVRIYVEEL